MDKGISILTGIHSRTAFIGFKYVEYPENSLHPLEQIKAAEELVLEFKKSRKPINIRSFFPDYIQAVRLYMQKYELADEFHGYVVGADHKIIECDIDDCDALFEDFAGAFDKLMELRSDIENKEDEEDEWH